MKLLPRRIYLVLAILLGLVWFCDASQVTFEWTPDATHKIVHLKTVSQNQFLFLAEQTNGSNRLTVDMQPGTYRVAGTAQKPDGRWAEHSDPIDVVVEASPPTFVLEGGTLTVNKPTKIILKVLFSHNLKHWTDRPYPAARFFRVQASTL